MVAGIDNWSFKWADSISSEEEYFLEENKEEIEKNMQNIYKCKNFSPNDNLNKTCNNSERCVLIEGEKCYKYEVENGNSRTVKNTIN